MSLIYPNIVTETDGGGHDDNLMIIKTILEIINGRLDNDNISSVAGIATSKLSSTTANGVLVGGTTATASVTATALTNGQLLVGSTASAPVATTITAGSNITVTNGAGSITIAGTAPAQQLTLLKANSGTDASAGATNVDTVAISGLTSKDTLLVYINCDSLTQATAQAILYSVTDSTNVIIVTGGASIPAGIFTNAQVNIRQAQQASTTYSVTNIRADNNGNSGVNGVASSLATAFTGSWTLALRHGGVTAGGTFRWSWSVYKVTGQ